MLLRSFGTASVEVPVVPGLGGCGGQGHRSIGSGQKYRYTADKERRSDPRPDNTLSRGVRLFVSDSTGGKHRNQFACLFFQQGGGGTSWGVHVEQMGLG